MHGRGIYDEPGCLTYDGELKDDKMHGKGILTLHGDGIYEGKWKNDFMHGKYTYTSLRNDEKY